MAPQPIHILPRDEDGSSKTALYTAGFVIAGMVILGVVAYLTIRYLRQRARKNGEDSRGAAFLNIRGLVREDSEKDQGESLPKYGYQSFTPVLDSVINCVLTRVFYFPIIVIFMVSRPICSRGPILVPKESSCLAASSPGRTLRNRRL